MKIKIIDLLNMRARNEEMPKQIKVGCCSEVFTYNGNSYTADDIPLYEYFNLFNYLNAEVEIIEENIEKFDIESENGRYRLKFNSCSYSLNDINYIILSKINEVIDAVNKLMENKKWVQKKCSEN